MAKAKRNVQDNYNSVFAKRLRELIETSGVSQAELANSVGVTRQAINSYTLGNTVPNSDVLTDIAKYFDVSADYLLGLTDVKSNDTTVKSICEEIGLSDKSVNLLIDLNRIKKLEEEARTLLAKDTNPVHYAALAQTYQRHVAARRRCADQHGIKASRSLQHRHHRQGLRPRDPVSR